jgi:hypothetical protein
MRERFENVYRRYISDYAKMAGVDTNIKSTYNRAIDRTNILLYRYLRRRHIQDRESLRKESHKTYEFSKKEVVEIDPFSEHIDSSKYDKVMNISENTVQFEKPFVAEIKDGRVLKRSGISTTNDYNIITDSSSSNISVRHNIITVPYLLEKVKKNISSKRKDYDYDRAVAFTSAVRPNGFTNYYVWVHNYLTKLHGLYKYKESTNNSVKIIIPENSPSWALESLKFFGYTDDIIFWDPSKELKIRRLLIPSNRNIERFPGMTNADRKITSPSACNWIRNESRKYLSNKVNLDFAEKILISRADAGKREIRNRDEVKKYLHNLGFVSYELSDLTFRQQVALFSQADHVVGVHGAGLVNLLFAEDCTITEIFGDKFVPTYYLLTQSIGLPYQTISGESITNKNVGLHHQDIKVDINKLRSKFEM